MQSKRADVRIIDSETLSDNWYNLKKYTFDLQRRDGEWQRQQREVYDRGNGATILLYNREKKNGDPDAPVPLPCLYQRS